MSQKVSEYTVESILSLYTKSISTSFDEKIIDLEGFYQKTGSKPYNGIFYDTLYDEDKQHKMTLVIKQRQRDLLHTGQYYKFQGYLNRYDRNSKDGAFQLLYKITKVVDQVDEHQFISKEEFDLVRKRFDRSSIDIQGHLLQLLRDKVKPHITIILGSTSIVDEDYKSEINGCDLFTISEQRIPFTSPSKLVEILNRFGKSETNLLICMRGGGSGLEIFNHSSIAEEALKLKVPFATAIGHKEDITMLQRVSDKAFATPTAFGSFLRNIETTYLNEIKEIEDKDIALVQMDKRINELVTHQNKQVEIHQEDKKQLESIFNQRQEKNKLTIKRLLIAFLITLLVAILAIYLLIKN